MKKQQLTASITSSDGIGFPLSQIARHLPPPTCCLRATASPPPTPPLRFFFPINSFARPAGNCSLCSLLLSFCVCVCVCVFVCGGGGGLVCLCARAAPHTQKQKKKAVFVDVLLLQLLPSLLLLHRSNECVSPFGYYKFIYHTATVISAKASSSFHLKLVYFWMKNYELWFILDIYIRYWMIRFLSHFLDSRFFQWAIIDL